MNDNISTPSAKNLFDYLSYQYPSTQGDILLKKTCDSLAQTSKDFDKLLDTHSTLLVALEYNRKERNELKNRLKAMTRDTQVLRCAYCGHEYPPNTPDHNDEALSAHIQVCLKHPMREKILELNEWKAVAHRLASIIPNRFNRTDGQDQALKAYTQLSKQYESQPKTWCGPTNSIPNVKNVIPPHK